MEEQESLYAVVFAGNKQKPHYNPLVPTDPFSRYKVRQLQIQYEKGCRTSLVNINDVAKDMRVPASYICAYLGYSFGAKFNFSDVRAPKRQAFIAYRPSLRELTGTLKKFITEVVLCTVCNLPELIIEIGTKPEAKARKEQDIKTHCQACGATTSMKISNDRFRKFILTNPQTARQSDSFLISHEKEFVDSDESSSEEDDEDVVWLADTSEAAVAQRKKDVLGPSSFFTSLGNSSETN